MTTYQQKTFDRVRWECYSGPQTASYLNIQFCRCK